MTPFMQNSRKCKPIYSDRIDSWLPRDRRSRRKDYKEAEEPLGMRNTFLILMWWWLHVCVCSSMSDSWWWLHESIQRSNCTETADRLSKTRTENWPFNSGTWWSSVILMGTFGRVRRTRLDGMHSWESRRKGFKKVSTNDSFQEYFTGEQRNGNCMQFNMCQLYLNKPIQKKKADGHITDVANLSWLWCQ